MNFSQSIKQGDLALELKYCERCGGLWLRCPGDEESYCDNCRAAMATWPHMRKHGALKRINVHSMNKETLANTSDVYNPEQLIIETLLGIADARKKSECEPVVRLEEVRV